MGLTEKLGREQTWYRDSLKFYYKEHGYGHIDKYDFNIEGNLDFVHARSEADKQMKELFMD